ncbi:MAG: hypothetical protein JXA54_07710 [Candidatus Heimdallarchaeota archaeon]|nr:hypothetical protein [Candidatus Heimdallarchaeota archaeon]
MTTMLYTLEGIIITPIITTKPILKKGPVWIEIMGDKQFTKKPQKSYIGQLVKGEREAPIIQRGYRGYVRVTCLDEDASRAKATIKKYLAKDFLGKNTTDGFGKIQWFQYREEIYQKPQPISKRKKLKIRKGLGTSYPEQLEQLLIALIFHDFVHTEKHLSKIYQEIAIEDSVIQEACKNHHNGEENNNQLLPIIKYYDGLAAFITRKSQSKRTNRYDWENGEIDFKQLAKELEQKQESAVKLYNYIYNSRELVRIVEAINYGKNSLRNHLLLMVNLAINDYYKGKITITKGKISLSARKREELGTARDAETQSFSDQENTDLKSPTNSRNKEV